MLPAVLFSNLSDKTVNAFASTRQVLKMVQTLTPAQINAGFTLIAPGHEAQLRFLGGTLIIGAAALTGVTLLRIVTTDATPVVLAQFAVADLTANAKYGTNSVQFVLGAGALAALGRGVGVRVDKTGGAAAGATTATFLLEFDLVG